MNDFGFKLDCEYEGIDYDGEWEHHRYTVRLIRDTGSMTVPYRMGMAHDDEPTIHDVLQSLQSDARIVIYDDFDDVFGDMPFSKARKLADQCEKQTERLRRILGDDWETFMNHDFDEEDE
jgi:hypothetical protein